MKRIAAVVLAAATALSLAACDPDGEKTERRTDNARYRYCVGHGGSYATHGGGSTYECRFPGVKGGKVNINVDNK
jgi:hypothetical protein